MSPACSGAVTFASRPVNKSKTHLYYTARCDAITPLSFAQQHLRLPETSVLETTPCALEEVTRPPIATMTVFFSHPPTSNCITRSETTTPRCRTRLRTETDRRHTRMISVCCPPSPPEKEKQHRSSVCLPPVYLSSLAPPSDHRDRGSPLMDGWLVSHHRVLGRTTASSNHDLQILPHSRVWRVMLSLMVITIKPSKIRPPRYPGLKF